MKKEVGGKSCADWLLVMKKARVVTFPAYIKSSSHLSCSHHITFALPQSVCPKRNNNIIRTSLSNFVWSCIDTTSIPRYHLLIHPLSTNHEVRCSLCCSL